MREIVRKFNGLPKKSIGIAGAGILMIVIVLVIMLIPKGNKDNLELRRTIFTFEYGEDIVLLPSDVLTTKDEEILQKAKMPMTFPNETAENGEYIIKVGTYTQRITYEGNTKEFKVKVQDTTAPEFVDFKDTIEVEKGTEEIDYSNYFKAIDLSGASVDVDHSKVDLSKTGEYEITVTAIDNNKNKIEKEAKVIVKDKVEDKEDSDDTNQDTQVTGDAGSGTNTTNGSTGTSTNTGGGSSTGNTGGGTPSNSTPTPSEPIVQLTPTPLGGQIFDTDIAAANWADSIVNDWDTARKYAAKFGYSDITNYITTQIAYGYASTGEIVIVKYSVTWTFQ